MSGIQTYHSGTPLGPVVGACNLPNAGSCYADFNPSFSGPVRINGSYGSGVPQSTPFISRAAFQNPAPFTFGNTPRTLPFGLRAPGFFNEDLGVMRSFKLHENWLLQIRAEAFNAFNRVIFAAPNFEVTSAAFGTIGTQANSPRILQFAAKIGF